MLRRVGAFHYYGRVRVCACGRVRLWGPAGDAYVCVCARANPNKQMCVCVRARANPNKQQHTVRVCSIPCTCMWGNWSFVHNVQLALTTGPSQVQSPAWLA